MFWSEGFLWPGLKNRSVNKNVFTGKVELLDSFGLYLLLQSLGKSGFIIFSARIF